MVPTPSRRRPPPHRKISRPKSLSLCSFLLPEREPFSAAMTHVQSCAQETVLQSTGRLAILHGPCDFTSRKRQGQAGEKYELGTSRQVSHKLPQNPEKLQEESRVFWGTEEIAAFLFQTRSVFGTLRFPCVSLCVPFALSLKSSPTQFSPGRRRNCLLPRKCARLSLSLCNSLHKGRTALRLRFHPQQTDWLLKVRAEAASLQLVNTSSRRTREGKLCVYIYIYIAPRLICSHNFAQIFGPDLGNKAYSDWKKEDSKTLKIKTVHKMLSRFLGPISL